MAKSFVPQGLRPIAKLGQNVNNLGYSTFKIANSYAVNIFKDDAVVLNTSPGDANFGTVQALVTSTNVPLGTFMGCKYVDPATKTPVWSNYFPSGTSSADGTIEAYVADDPNQVFVIQADATVTAGDRGYNFNVTVSAGNTLTGQSGMALKAASRTVGVGQLRIMDVWGEAGNAFGDAFPLVVAKWNRHIWTVTSTNQSTT